jgi:hypothetical protein
MEEGPDMQLDLLKNARRTAVELGVYLPLGAALAARDLVLSRDRLADLYEELVGRGREGVGSVVGRPRRQLERVKVEFEELARDAGEGAGTALEEDRPGTDETASGRIPPPTADQLPIERYDDLTAQQVVARVAHLTQEELDRVRAYERENRSRATILRAIEPRMGELPIQGYDHMTAEEIVRRLGDLSKAELQLVREYEGRTKSRSTIQDRIDSLAAS